MIDKTILVHPIAEAIRRGQPFEGSDVRTIQDRVIYVFQCELCFGTRIEER